jgi:hypothetical protein
MTWRERLERARTPEVAPSDQCATEQATCLVAAIDQYHKGRCLSDPTTRRVERHGSGSENVLCRHR